MVNAKDLRDQDFVDHLAARALETDQKAAQARVYRNVRAYPQMAIALDRYMTTLLKSHQLQPIMPKPMKARPPAKGKRKRDVDEALLFGAPAETADEGEYEDARKAEKKTETRTGKRG